MGKIILLAQGASEIQFENKHPHGMKMQLSNRFSHNVGYGKENTCRANLEVVIADKEKPEMFRIKAVVFGIFRYDADCTREAVHKQSFRELFPYARALVTTLTANAGLPPIYLPPVDIDGQSVYSVEVDPHGRPENT